MRRHRDMSRWRLGPSSADHDASLTARPAPVEASKLVEAVARQVALTVPGPASAVDVGDLPAGRPVWVVGRTPLGKGPLSFRLRTGAEVVAEDLVADRALVADLGDLAHHRDDRQVALARERAVVTA